MNGWAIPPFDRFLEPLRRKCNDEYSVVYLNEHWTLDMCVFSHRQYEKSRINEHKKNAMNEFNISGHLINEFMSFFKVWNIPLIGRGITINRGWL